MSACAGSAAAAERNAATNAGTLTVFYRPLSLVPNYLRILSFKNYAERKETGQYHKVKLVVTVTYMYQIGEDGVWLPQAQVPTP